MLIDQKNFGIVELWNLVSMIKGWESSINPILRHSTSFV